MPSTGPRADNSGAGLRRPAYPAEDVVDGEPTAADFGNVSLEWENGVKAVSPGDNGSDIAVDDEEGACSSDGEGAPVEWRAVLEDSRLVDLSESESASMPKPGSRTAAVPTAEVPLGAANDSGLRLQAELQQALAKDHPPALDNLDQYLEKSYLEKDLVDVEVDMRHGGPTVPAIMEAMALEREQKEDPLNSVLDFIGVADAQDVSEWVAASDLNSRASHLAALEVERRNAEYEDDLDVPDDQEVPARAPHSAAPTTTMHSRHAAAMPAYNLKVPSQLPSDFGAPVMTGVAGKSISAPPGGAAGHFMRSMEDVEKDAPLTSNEDEEWKSRQRINGVIGRMVRYLSGERPSEDILRLRSSRYGRIVVTAVREGGPASRAGVVAGDELVSIDGWKGFAKCAPHVIHACLKAPVTLIFVGFVGRLQAEVRVKPLPQPRLGMPRGQRLVGETAQTATSSSSVQLCDAVVFQQDPASIFILTREDADGNGNGSSGNPDEAVRAPPVPPIRPPNALYELGHEDAKSLVQKAFGSIATL
mmetsp:Transcript_61425/g.146437  ORF Transcript_61425/g.146437 Transcript_61425/m.146437 type:complete len:532 (+) Transcript_61425:102-1697(+)